MSAFQAEGARSSRVSRSNQDKHPIKELLLMGYWKTYEVDCDDGTFEDVVYEWVNDQTEEE